MSSPDYPTLIQRFQAVGVETEPALLQEALEGFVAGRDWVVQLYSWGTLPNLEIVRFQEPVNEEISGYGELPDGSAAIFLNIELLRQLKGASLAQTWFVSRYGVDIPVKARFTIRQKFESVGVEETTHWLQAQGCSGLAPVPPPEQRLLSPARQESREGMRYRLQPHEQEALVLQSLYFWRTYQANPLEELEDCLHRDPQWMLPSSKEDRAPGIAGVLKTALEYRRKLGTVTISQLTLPQKTLPELLWDLEKKALAVVNVHVGTVDEQIPRTPRTWNLMGISLVQLLDGLAEVYRAEWLIDDAGALHFLRLPSRPLVSEEQSARGTWRAKLRYRRGQPAGTILQQKEWDSPRGQIKIQHSFAPGDQPPVPRFPRRKYQLRLDDGECLWLSEVELVGLAGEAT